MNVYLPTYIFVIIIIIETDNIQLSDCMTYIIIMTTITANFLLYYYE